jgi:hypothetical protein
MPGKQLQMRCFGLPAYSGKRPPPLPRHRTASLARSGIGSLRGNPRLCLFRSDSAVLGSCLAPQDARYPQSKRFRVRQVYSWLSKFKFH